MKRVLEQEISNIFDELIGAENVNKHLLIEKFKKTLN